MKNTNNKNSFCNCKNPKLVRLQKIADYGEIFKVKCQKCGRTLFMDRAPQSVRGGQGQCE